jgi:glyoxylase-like metal-dependent hydrolase (beta-lactamase superfamily II)
MEAQSPAEMKRFGSLARALRLAGSLPVPYPRRGDVAAIAAYVSEVLAPFGFDEVRLLPPTRTFSEERQLDVGGRAVSLIEVGPAHTPGDLIVWVPDAKVAIAADILFIGVTPIMWAGPLAGWIAALEPLLGLGAERFVPGHGPICGPEEVRRLIDYWRWLDQAAGQRLGAGASPAETALELVLGDESAELGFAEWLAARAGAGQRGHDRRPPTRDRKAAGTARGDRRVLPHGAAGARPPSAARLSLGPPRGNIERNGVPPGVPWQRTGNPVVVEGSAVAIATKCVRPPQLMAAVRSGRTAGATSDGELTPASAGRSRSTQTSPRRCCGSSGAGAAATDTRVLALEAKAGARRPASRAEEVDRWRVSDTPRIRKGGSASGKGVTSTAAGARTPR